MIRAEEWARRKWQGVALGAVVIELLTSD